MTNGSTPGRNRLTHETSPYLLQHAGNPVDWYPWGEEAFARARELDRPVLLSVGYSACHWCHVMAHESFEDAAIASLMNDWFINIKVDREERPDIDAVYMTATQALTGQGGWPMTVFLTPEGEPFYAGTYFPPEDRWGRPGFPRLLENIHQAWLTDHDRVLESATTITGRLREASRQTAQGFAVTADDASLAVEHFRGAYDPVRGGFGGAPKFPSPANLEFLLMHQARAGDDGRVPSVREMVLRTLRRMAAGGIHDHLGGGFHRYSVDAEWLVPHFEKMLYDNAQLARVYLHAYQVTGEAEFELTARSTLDYLLRDMRHASGGFFAAQDADTEGIEGKSFVWRPEEIVEVLGGADGALFYTAYGVTPAGNFEDPHHPEFGRRSVLHLPRSIAELAAERGADATALSERLTGLRARLLAVREKRARPGLDDKVLTSWNGLALAAFAEAGRVLGEPRYIEAAQANARFAHEALWRNGALLHTWKDGAAKIPGLLEDYALYGLGLVELYRATGDLGWLDWARTLFGTLAERYHDEEGGGFFDTPADGEQLILRQKPLVDAAVPSGNGAAALLALWLARYDGRPDRERYAVEAFGLAGDHFTDHANGFGSMWQAAELMLAPHREAAIIGPPPARSPFERALAERYLPSLVIAPAAEGAGLPLLDGRGAPSGAVAYLCEEMACSLPATTDEAFREQLAALH